MSVSDDTLVRTLYRHSNAVLTALGCAATVSLDEVRQRLEHERGRPVHLISSQLPPDAPHGLYVAGEFADYVFYDCTTPTERQAQIIGHEYAHIIFGDSAAPAELVLLAGELSHHVEPAGPLNVCQRTVFDDPREYRAEMLGTVLLERASPRPRSAWRWLAAARVAWMLRPLWEAVTGVVPDLTLLPRYKGLSSWVSAARQMPLRRSRMLVEILDGYVLLRPWMSAEAEAVAAAHAARAGLRGAKFQVAVEAAVLAWALRGRRDGVAPPAAGEGPPAGHEWARFPGHVSSTLRSAWLGRVGRALRRSRIVSATLADMTRRHPRGPAPAR